MNTFAEKDVGAAWRLGVLSRYARTDDDNSTFESSRFSPSACGVRATRDRTLLMTFASQVGFGILNHIRGI